MRPSTIQRLPHLFPWVVCVLTIGCNPASVAPIAPLAQPVQVEDQPSDLKSHGPFVACNRTDAIGIIHLEVHVPGFGPSMPLEIPYGWSTDVEHQAEPSFCLSGKDGGASRSLKILDSDLHSLSMSLRLLLSDRHRSHNLDAQWRIPLDRLRGAQSLEDAKIEWQIDPQSSTQ